MDSDYGMNIVTECDALYDDSMMNISIPITVLGKWHWSPSPMPEAATSKARENISLNEFLHSTSGCSKESASLLVSFSF